MWIWNFWISYFKIFWVGFSKKYGDKYCRNFEICLLSFLFIFFVCKDFFRDIELLLKSDFLNILKVGLIIFNFFKLFKLIENIVLLFMLVVFLELNSRDDFLLVLVVVVEGKLFGICSCCSCFVRDVILVFYVLEIKSVEKIIIMKRFGYKVWWFCVRVEREGGRWYFIIIVKFDWLIFVNFV